MSVRAGSVVPVPGRPGIRGLQAFGRLLLTIAWLAAFPAAPADANTPIYRWTDDSGTIHYTQGLESVPLRHRETAVLIGYNRPASPADAGPARDGPAPGARVTFTPGEPIMVSARINGGGSVQLMLDTGASRTVISPSALTALGVSQRDARKGTIRGVTGEAEVLAVRVDMLEVEGARHGPLLVVSHDTGFGRGDGLLGRDFLDHFLVTIDNGSGIVTLVPK